MRRALAVLIAASVVFVIAVAPVAAATRAVAVKDNVFSPKSISISKGTTVKWVWHGTGIHNVVSGGIRSAVMTRGSFTHKFSTRGTYTFICTVHPGMTMKVKVH